jgi:hypothetical protein
MTKHVTRIPGLSEINHHAPRRLQPRAAHTAAMIALLVLVAGSAARADAPPYVAITPNAIQKPDQPIEIAISGRRGQRLYLLILRNCDTDRNTADTPQPNCDSLVSVRPIDLRDSDRWSERRPLTEVPARLYGETLWLRVSPNRDGRWPYGDAMFTMVSKPCSVWDTVIDLFSTNGCNADVASTLRPQMGGNDERPAVALEVRRLVRDAGKGTWAKPVSVPGTRGATGVAWADARSLFVTVGRIEDDVLAVINETAKPVAPGLYRFDIAGGKRELLLAGRDDEILAAPFAVGPDAMVFVRERVVADRDGTVAKLVVWDRGRIVREIPLRRTIHQILAADSKRTSVLAYSRWEGIPALLRVDLRTGAVTHLGFAEQLFQAVMRPPGGSHAVVALQDNAGYNGWDIILVDGKGKLAAELAVGPAEDLMPAWRPDRPDELAYLGQSDGRTEAP